MPANLRERGPRWGEGTVPESFDVGLSLCMSRRHCSQKLHAEQRHPPNRSGPPSIAQQRPAAQNACRIAGKHLSRSALSCFSCSPRPWVWPGTYLSKPSRTRPSSSLNANDRKRPSSSSWAAVEPASWQNGFLQGNRGLGCISTLG